MSNILGWLALPTTLLAVCVVAWRIEAKAERLGSLLILLADIAADALLALDYPHFPSASMCAIDFALAVGLLCVALKYSNLWLGGAMLLQSGALCLQALDLGGDGPSTLTHIIANNLISYTMLACIVAGVIGSWRAKLATQRRSGDIHPHPAAA